MEHFTAPCVVSQVYNYPSKPDACTQMNELSLDDLDQVLLAKFRDRAPYVRDTEHLHKILLLFPETHRELLLNEMKPLLGTLLDQPDQVMDPNTDKTYA